MRWKEVCDWGRIKVFILELLDALDIDLIKFLLIKNVKINIFSLRRPTKANFYFIKLSQSELMFQSLIWTSKIVQGYSEIPQIPHKFLNL